MKLIGQRLFLIVAFTLLYLPILILILYSFNDAKFSLQWHGVSTHWYQELFHDHE